MIMYLAGRTRGYPGFSSPFMAYLFCQMTPRLISYHWDANLFEGLEERLQIYLAGGENECWLTALEKAGISASLLSYFYLTKNKSSEKIIVAASNIIPSIFLDSGGFSAYSKGAVINLEDYILFVKKYLSILSVYAVLDVIGNAEATQRNQIMMEEAGLAPLPVYHYGEPLSVLKGLADKYSYIAIGGMVPIAREQEMLERFLASVFSVTTTKIKVHGFGMTNYRLLQKYPFYSVDSTSWLGGSMRAEVYFFKEGRLFCQKTTDRNTATASSFMFTDDGDKKWMARVINNAISWQRAAEYITELWKKRGVNWDA